MAARRGNRRKSVARYRSTPPCNPGSYLKVTARDAYAPHLAGPGAGSLSAEREAPERTAAMAGLTGWHLVILIAVMVLLFGAKRLPDMARAVGQSTRIFKQEIKHDAAADQPDQRSIADRTHPPTP